MNYLKWEQTERGNFQHDESSGKGVSHKKKKKKDSGKAGFDKVVTATQANTDGRTTPKSKAMGRGCFMASTQFPSTAIGK